MPQNRGAIWGHILVRVLALITIPLHSDEPDLALKTTAQFGREYGARSRVLFLLQNLTMMSPKEVLQNPRFCTWQCKRYILSIVRQHLVTTQELMRLYEIHAAN